MPDAPIPPIQEKINNVLAQVCALYQEPTLLLSLPDIGKHLIFSLEECLRGSNFEKLNVVLQTPGGDPHAAFTLVKLLRRHASFVRFLVPIFAKSAGTLMCLGADEIVMTDYSELGPLDIQIQEKKDGDRAAQITALNGFKALEQVQKHSVQNLSIAYAWISSFKANLKMLDSMRLAIEYSTRLAGHLYDQLDPKIIGEYARNLDLGASYARRILVDIRKMPEQVADPLINRLVYEYPDHGFVLDQEEVVALGLHCTSMPDTLIQPMRDLGIDLLTQSSDQHRVQLFLPKPVPESSSDIPLGLAVSPVS